MKIAELPGQGELNIAGGNRWRLAIEKKKNFQLQAKALSVKWLSLHEAEGVTNLVF
jgi:hypothetical protein